MTAINWPAQNGARKADIRYRVLHALTGQEIR